MAWTIFVNAATLAGDKENTGVVIATDATVEERNVWLPLTPNGARIILSEIGIAQLMTFRQGGDFRVAYPRETG